MPSYKQPYFFKKYKAFLIFSVIIAVIFFNLPNIFTIRAQSTSASQSLEISPPSIEITADPGQTITHKVKVRNMSQKSLPLSVHVLDFTAIGEEGQVNLENIEGPWSIAKWTSISPSKFTLEPGTTREVTATIKVPAKNTAGGRYGSLVFSIVNEKSDLKNAASVSQEVASLFLIRISGPVNERLSLINFSAPSFSEFGPVPFSLKFQNTGNVHVKVSGLINVMNFWGKKVADVVIPPTNIFPSANRIVKAEFGQWFLFGPYQAIAIVYFGTGNPTITQYTTFFVFPVRIIALIVIIIVLLYLVRRRIKKALKALVG